MKIIQAGRRFGKTVRMVAWVKQGERLPVFPFWTRVMLIAAGGENYRKRLMEEYNLDKYQIYTAQSQEWLRGRGGVPVEVGIDDVHVYLDRIVGNNRLAIMSVDDDEEYYEQFHRTGMGRNDNRPKYYPSERPNEIGDGRNMPDLKA